jgi:O-antigen ligase
VPQIVPDKSISGSTAGPTVSGKRSSSRRPSRDEEAKVRSNRVSLYVLVGLLAFAPFAFGAVEYWAIAVVELLAVILAVTWVIGGVRRGEIHLGFNSMAWAAVGLQLWIILQLMLGRTLDRNGTRDSLFLLFSYFLVFLVVSNERWSSRLIRNLGFWIAAIGVATALLGIIQFFSWNGKLYWIRALDAGTPFGPYVNRNHFAGLMEMTIPISLGLSISQRLARVWRILLTVFSVVMALALFISVSRGGILSLTASLFVFVYLFSRRREAKLILFTVGLSGMVVLAGLMWLGTLPQLERVLSIPKLNQEASYRDRLRIAKDTLQLIQEHPYMGTGLGTFALAIPPYLSWSQKVSWDKTHNDYLQLLSEVGLGGFAFAVCWILGLFHSVLARVRDKTESMSPMRLGAFCGCVSLLIHSLVDFNLQIPANALFFTVLAALATRKNNVRRIQPSTETFPIPAEQRPI